VTKYDVGDIIAMEFSGTSIHYLVENIYSSQGAIPFYSLRLLEENIIKETYVYIVDNRKDVRKEA